MDLERLGPYRIGMRIGRGGMGEVYEGLNEKTGERVAVKILNPQLAMTTGFRDRFEAEIDSLRKLRHPNIVQMLGFGEHDGHLFYSMEFVAGRNLEDELTAGRRFDWREITQIGIKLCKALKHAHDNGIIHRDLKPANIVLTDDGDIKLLDFGIARFFGATNLTSAGGVLGTADYMSPEQADGRPVTNRCDQYSLGCVLYALATGRPPFRAETLPELLQLQRFVQPEPPSRFARDLPMELERVILQLLEKEPEKRFPNMSILARHMSAMERALSRPVETDDFDDFQVNPEPTGAGSAAELSSATRDAPDSIDDSHLDATLDRPSSPPTARRAHTGTAGSHEVTQTPSELDPDADEPIASRFTTLAEEARREAEKAKEPWTAAIARVGSLSVALALTVFAVWYLLRPPTADSLYGRIQAAAEEGRSELVSAEDEIAEFLMRYPDDERSDEVADYSREVDLLQTERRLRLRSRLSGTSKELAPIERMYVEAVDLKDSDPVRAAEILRAIIDLYDDTGPMPQTQEQCLELARRQLESFQDRAQSFRLAQIESMRNRLEKADQVAETDPEKARRMWQAIIELVGDEAWAEEIVLQARTRLNQHYD